jgi:hypothetical protein
MRRMLLPLLPLALGLVACDEEVALILPTGADVLFQNPPTQVDILLVVDNSCSMQDEQDKLSQGFDAFVEFFDVADVDYQIGITTTDMQDPNASGRLVGAQDERIIRRETPDAEQLFRDNVRVGVNGSPFERGFDAARAALTDQLDGPNEGFIREDALLSIIFVSDEEDASAGPVNTMVDQFRMLKGERDRDSFNASVLVGIDPVTGEPADCGRDPDDPNVGAAAGERYADLASQTHGVVASICEDEFNDIVGRMGLASSRLKDVFELTSRPREDTVEVFAYFADDPEAEVALPADGHPGGDGQPEISPWVVESDEAGDVFWVRFTDVTRLPPLNTRLVINYRFA